MGDSSIGSPVPFSTAQAIEARHDDHSVGGATFTRAEAASFLLECRMNGVSDGEADTALRDAGYGSMVASAHSGVGREATTLERRLVDAGFLDPSKADGVIDGDTATALRAFQHERGIPETGAADPATMREFSFDIAENQSLLTALGCDPHGVDQVMGRHTHDAIRAFQEQHHITPATGTLTPETRTALRDSRTELINWGAGRAEALRAQTPPISNDLIAWARRDPTAFRASAESHHIDPDMVSRTMRIAGFENAVDKARNGIRGSGDTLAAVEHLGELRNVTNFGILGILANQPPPTPGFGR